MKYLIFSLLCFLFSLIKSFGQDIVDGYEVPEVIEGSNLAISSYPNISSSLENQDSARANIHYNVNLSVRYAKWRFTNSVNYAFYANTSADIFHDIPGLLYESESGRLTSYWSLITRGGLDFYPFKKNNFFTGMDYDAGYEVQSDDKPYLTVNFNPSIGFGRVIDAYVINEASNIESVLKDESYITSKFSIKTRDRLNSLLDKRENEFPSKYRDNSDIEFFTALEKFLISEGIINRPLNARTTMKIYQLFNDNRYVYYPVLKGWHVMSELGLEYHSRYEDTIHFPVSLTLSGLYGIPLNNKTGLAFSAAVIYPLNNYNYGALNFNIHSPVLLRSTYNLQFVSQPDFLFFEDDYGDIYDFKLFSRGILFYPINKTFGISAGITFAAGKVKNINFYHQYTEANVSFRYNILAKMGIESSLYLRNSNKYIYTVALYSRIFYYIF